MKQNDVLEIFGNNSKYFLNFFLLKMQTLNFEKLIKGKMFLLSILLPFNILTSFILEKI